MTFKGLLLLLVVFLVVRAVRKAMQRSEAKLPAPSRARGAVSGKTASAGAAGAQRAKADAEPKAPSSGQPAEGRATPTGAGSEASPRSPHEVLGVAPGASADEVRAAYQRLARSYHPDRVEGLAPELRELAHQRMVEINRAYEALSRGSDAS